MSIRSFISERNDWVAADHIERLKDAALLVFLGGATLIGVTLLAIGLAQS